MQSLSNIYNKMNIVIMKQKWARLKQNSEIV